MQLSSFYVPIRSLEQNVPLWPLALCGKEVLQPIIFKAFHYLLCYLKVLSW